MEGLLSGNLTNGERRTSTFEGGAYIEAWAADNQVLCTIHHPLEKQVPTHPKLRYHSNCTV